MAKSTKPDNRYYTLREDRYGAEEIERYHDKKRCPHGKLIAEEDRVTGTGDRFKCDWCDRRHQSKWAIVRVFEAVSDNGLRMGG